MNQVIERFGLLLLIAAIVSMAARKLKLPYTVGLVVAGIMLSFVPGGQPVALTKDLIFTVLLPPLIFEAAFQLQWPELKRELPIIGLLATLGLIISAIIVAVGVHAVIGWSWPACILVAVMLSATDPVAVIATFKSLGVKGRLQLLVEAESLFNDGTAAVLFAIALAAASGKGVTGFDVASGFVLTVAGGVLCGLLVGGCALLFTGRTEDHLVEISFTTFAAYGSFLAAESLHLSGVLATLTAGILVRNVVSLGALTDRGKNAVESVWEYIAFVANSVVFLLIGSSLQLDKMAPLWATIALTTVLLLAGRAAGVYLCCAAFGRSRLKLPLGMQHVLFWGGLRGALALALALGLPSDFDHRQEILSLTFAVVAISVIAQGVTMPALLKRLKVTGEPEAILTD